MTAAEYQAMAANTAQEVSEIEGRTEQILLRGIVAAAEAFDHMAPLPPLKPHPRVNSWEPAARRYRDIEPEEKVDQ